MGEDGRVLLRKSGTEPLIRVMVEAKSEKDSDKWAQYIADEVKKAG
jgi:phosphoglucosamine mutase